MITKDWPVGHCQPLTIKNDYTWKEFGSVFKLIDLYRVGLVVETGVGSGDFAAWMLAKCLFDPEFHYTGVTLDVECVHPKVREMLPLAPQAFIAPGLSYSDAILSRMRKFVNNSYKPAMVFCSGQNKVKEFEAYINKVLRPGDVVVVTGFPVEFSLRYFQSYITEEKLKRVSADLTLGTRFIAGVVL